MSRLHSLACVPAWLLLAGSGCGGSAGTFEGRRSALETLPLIVTEVAQSAAYGGSTADKVEVLCTSASGCGAFKICDTSGSGSACSAVQTALGSGQRAVVSRGTSITTTDEVWLADSAGTELSGTRVGPFPCASGQSESR